MVLAVRSIGIHRVNAVAAQFEHETVARSWLTSPARLV